MRWVEQRVNSQKAGDCLRACIASITDIDDLPNFAELDDSWDAVRAILRNRGWDLMTKPPTWKSRNPCIAVVRSPTYAGTDHAVVWLRDRAIWDPSPLRNEPGRNLTSPRYFISLARYSA